MLLMRARYYIKASDKLGNNENVGYENETNIIPKNSPIIEEI